MLNFYKGEIYRLKGDKDDNYTKAIAFYKESIEANKNFPKPYKEIGLLQLKLGETEKAKKNLKKYLEISKNAEDAAIIESYLN